MAEIGAESGQGEDKRGKAAGGRLHDGVKVVGTGHATGTQWVLGVGTAVGQLAG